MKFHIRFLNYPTFQNSRTYTLLRDQVSDMRAARLFRINVNEAKKVATCKLIGLGVEYASSWETALIVAGIGRGLKRRGGRIKTRIMDKINVCILG